MRVFSKMAVATAAAGLAVVGTVAAGGGVAHADTDQSASGCSVSAVVLEAGVLSSCTAGTTTIDDPTSYTLTTTEPGLASGLVTTLTTALDGLGLTDVSALLGQLENLTENVSFNLACVVNGATVTEPVTYTALADNTTENIDLSSLVGSAVPNSCEVQDFTVQSLANVSALDLALINGLPSTLLSASTPLLGSLSTLLGELGLPTLTGLTGADLSDILGLSVSATLTADTAVPGAIWTGAGATSAKNVADICVDDAANGLSGSLVQVYQCNSDLAQYWVQDTDNQLVHNGDCMAQSGSKAVLETCNANPAQTWTVHGTGGAFGEIVNKATGDCLTWPKAADFTPVTVTGCTDKAGELFTAPPVSAA